VKFFDASLKLLIESGVGVVDEVCDVDEPIFTFDATCAVHCWYFDAVQDEVWEFILFYILMPSGIVFDFLLKLFVLFDLKMNGPI
jgi:hypothetical protein